MPTNPFNIKMLDVDSYIKKHQLKPVTSQNIHESSSNMFHQDGLFSEEIFGQVATTDRFVKFGYIDLNTLVFQPIVYKTLGDLKGFYWDIMQGSTYARFDPEEKDFVRCTKDDPEGGTGFTFFMQNFHKLELKPTRSRKRDDKIALLKIYEAILTMGRMLVLPAGARDLREEDGVSSSEEINKLYFALLRLSRQLNKSITSPLYDPVRCSIQKKVYEIYLYIKNILDDKSGFLQSKYGSRSLALGTRNVISAASLAASNPKDSRYHKHDETMLPLYQTMKGAAPVVAYHLRALFFQQVFTQGSSSIPVIDPDTKKLGYQNVSESEKSKFLSTEGIETMISRFEHASSRFDPVSIASEDHTKRFWLFLVYDLGDRIYIFRDIDAFKHVLDGKVDESKIRPMTYMEMFYMATYRAIQDKYCLVTRYPVLGVESIYPSKIHLSTTAPSRRVLFASQFDEKVAYDLPNYPVIGAESIDNMAVHPSKLPNLGGDHDGDTVSANLVLMEDSNKEIDEYFNSPKSMITANRELISGGNSDMIKLMMFNMSRL